MLSAQPRSDTIAQPQPKIVNGNTADIGQFPWQVALSQSTSDLYLGQFCAGTIIDAEWVITAAHCVDNIRLPTKPLFIAAGVTDLRADQEQAQIIAVDQIIIHPQFEQLGNSAALNHDIALLRLRQPIDFAACGTRCLAIDWLSSNNETNLLATGTAVRVNGWGQVEDCTTSPERCENLSTEQLSPTALRWTTLNIVNCLARPSEHFSFNITANMICAAAPRFASDTCQGDSGGGLTVVDPRQRRTLLAGITSWGTGCAQPNFPGAYTRVARYDQWIQNRMAGVPTSQDPVISNTENPNSLPAFVSNGGTSATITRTSSSSGGSLTPLSFVFLGLLGLWQLSRRSKT
ncbi:MAG: serine protease [Pseudomonadota bacterium]|nr:serine protease [Pseudomonadota bacterium]